MHWATLTLLAGTQLAIGKLAAGPISTSRGVPRDGNDGWVAVIVIGHNIYYQVRVSCWDTGSRITSIDL